MILNSVKNKLAIASIFLLIIVTAICSFLILERYHNNNKWVKHTHEVIETLQELQLNLNASESEARAFIISVDQFHHENYKQRKGKVNEFLKTTEKLTVDNTIQQSNLLLLRKLVNDRLSNLEFKMDYRLRKGLDKFLLTSTKEGSELMRRADNLVMKMKVEEIRLLLIRNQKVELSRKISVGVIIGSTFLNLLIVIILIVNTGMAFTETKKAQLKLMKSYREIVDLNRQKNYLLGMAAHDLRGPVANITQICEIMFPVIEEKINKQDFDFIKNIQISSMYVSNLLNDLLDVSVIESGKLIINNSDVAVHPFIQNIWKLNQLFANKKGTDVLLSNSTSTELTIQLDALKIEQVINNLISNAIKFSPPGSLIKFTVATCNDDLRVSIHDEGPGIPLNEQKQLFRAFQRTSIQATGGEKSTGLGLMISANIIKGHGGVIGLNSEPGKGSEFYFEIPL